mgnify:CR=1 FL=1|tara:strand:- start:447 stop:938 length:492 start_codon:yes stop_codon:yes gene_type:complete
MKQLRKKLWEIYTESNNELVFVTKMAELFSDEIGFKLLTFTVLERNYKFAKRFFSSDEGKYPVGGTKPIPENNWAKTTICERKSFIGNNKVEIEKYFFDHKIITDLGCASIINQVILYDARTIGTVNILNEEQYFIAEHAKKAEVISKFLTALFLNQQIKIEN